MQKDYYFYLIAIVVGLGVTMQAGVNTQLQLVMKNPLISSLVSFLIGTAVLLIAILITDYKSFFNLSNISQAPWWQLTGGVFGVIYIGSIIIVAPKIGAANMIGFVVASQLLFSLLFDHFGWLGFPIRQINWSRIVGAVLLISGLYFIKK